MGQGKRKRSQRQTASRLDWFFFLAGFSLLVLPLIYDGKALDSSLYPRLLALLGFLIVFFLLFFWKRFLSRLDTGIIHHPLLISMVAYFLVTLFSLLFAVNITAGYFDVVKTFSTVVVAVVASLVLSDTPDWPRRLTRFFILGAFISLSVGYYQYYFEIGFGFHDRWAVYDVKGMMSNINLYANYLMMMVPFLVYGIIVYKDIWRRLSSVALLLTLFMLLLLQTRAAYIGLMAGVPAAVLVLLVFYRQFRLSLKWRNRIGVLFLGVAMLLGGLVVMMPEDNKYVSRARSIFTDTDNPRILIWKICLHMISDRPLTGAGAGNFAIRVQEYYNKVELGEWQINWIRPHNDFLWVATEKGIPGLIIYLTIFGLLFYYALKAIRGSPGSADMTLQEKWLALLMVFGVFSYMVNSMFDFPLERVNHQVIFSFYVSSLLVLTRPPKAEGREAHAGGRGQRWIAIPVLLMLLTGALYTYKGLRQEYSIYKAREAEASGNWSDMLHAARQAATPWKTLDPLAVPVSFLEGYALFGMDNYQEALTVWETSRKQNPNRKYILQNLGVLYNHFERYDDTIEVLEALFSMYPIDDLNARHLSEAYYYRERYDEALHMLEAIPEQKRSEPTENNIIHIRAVMEANNKPEQTVP